jgi:hypothetical protein
MQNRQNSAIDVNISGFARFWFRTFGGRESATTSRVACEAETPCERVFQTQNSSWSQLKPKGGPKKVEKMQSLTIWGCREVQRHTRGSNEHAGSGHRLFANEQLRFVALQALVQYAGQGAFQPLGYRLSWTFLRDPTNGVNTPLPSS